MKPPLMAVSYGLCSYLIDKTGMEIVMRRLSGKTVWKAKNFFMVTAVSMTLLCFAGCGGGGSSAASDSMSTAGSPENAYSSGEITMEQPEAGAEISAEAPEDSSVSVETNRKLVKTVTMDVETEEFDTLIQKVEEKVDSLGGYLESLNRDNGSTMKEGILKNASMTIRIPKDKLDGFVSELEESSNVKSMEESAEDITLQYVDMESHKEALKAEQDRLLELLKHAQSMEEIIVLEERLAEVRYELESMESQLRTYDNLVDYATINLYVEEVESLTPVVQMSAWEKMSVGFLESAKNIGRGIKNFFIYLVVYLPYLILWAVIILAVLLIVRFFSKRSSQKPKEKPYPKYGAYGKEGYRPNYGYQRPQYRPKENEAQPGQPADKTQTEKTEKEEKL